MPIIVVGAVASLLVGYVAGVDPVVDFVKGIADGLAAMADAVVSLLPNASDLGLEGGAGWIPGYSWANTFLPLTETLVLLGIWVTVRMAIFAWRLADRAWHVIPKPMSGT